MYNNVVLFPGETGDAFQSLPAESQSAVARRMTEHCRLYKGANVKSALFQLTTTLSLFFALSALMLYGLVNEIYLVPMLLIVPAAGLLVRLFIIQHDCGHGSFFASRFVNDLVGRGLSVFTFTPYDVWRRSHNMHHASSGNLSQRGVGSIDTLTVREYEVLPPRQKLAYRIYRNPFILLALATPLYIILVQRFPSAPALPYFADYRHISFSQTWRSVFCLDLALIVVYGLLTSVLGWKVFVFGCLPAVVITSWIGGWLFFIQHQFEDSYWDHKDGWNFHDAALHGSSYYALPRVLQWFSGSIGLHHIHHLCPAIPNYKLQSCLEASLELQGLNRMTIKDSLKCVRWALWDEERKKMISFRDLRSAA